MSSTAPTLEHPESKLRFVPFLGEEVCQPYDRSTIVILPIPFEATTTYRRGCAYGPEAILQASQQVEYYDEELEWEVCYDVGIYTAPPVADSLSDPAPDSATMLRSVQETLLPILADGKFVISLGGEHSITEAIVAAYQAQNSEPFTVIQIDAHGDLRQEYEGSIHNHACVMRRVLDRGLPTLQIGIRAICKEEADLIKAKNLKVFRARNLVKNPHWIAEALATITTPKVFLTIDLDGLDPTTLPGVGTPEPGGLDWYSLLDFLRQVFDRHEVIGADIMELAPLVDSVVSQFTAAKLTYKLIGYYANGQQDRGLSTDL
ncbi:MAG: agmatinase [Prochlorotrichaceae cyanobacterium]|jgi:agmatinase